MCPPTPDRSIAAALAKRRSIAKSSADDNDAHTRPETKQSKDTVRHKDGSFPVVSFSLYSLVGIVLCCGVVSFAIGHLSSHGWGPRRMPSVESPWLVKVVTTVSDSAPVVPSLTHSKAAKQDPTTFVHLPSIPTDRLAPYNRYSFETFDTSSGIQTRSILLGSGQADEAECDIEPNGDCATPGKSTLDGHDREAAREFDSSTESDSTHEPSGQHLLVDFEHVDADFLRSETRLAQAMIDLIQTSSMTMLSYHCHSASDNGVSCVGVLLESHVSVHTWPQSGRLALDLFSCGPHSIIPLLSVIYKLFGTPQSFSPSSLLDATKHEIHTSDTDATVAAPPEPHMVWSFKARGFRPGENAGPNPTDADLHWLLGFMHVAKHHVATVTTDYQRIDIYDMMEPRLEVLDRVVFLDGIIQSRSLGEHAYHEALVHPALFCHARPRRVVIIGGGEGATLREVLKHKTVEQVIMVEIDKDMVETSRQYLPEWSYCGNLAGSTDSCFDDPRATVHYTDAVAWFIDRYGANATIDEDDLLDVIIMDALDPNSVDFSDYLYNNDGLVEAFSRALGDDGIFIAQVGELDNADDPPEYIFPDNQFVSFVKGLEAVGFESIVDYAEAHGRLVESWSFVLAMKNSESRSSWFVSEAELNTKIAKRSRLTVTGDVPFVFFDGASMAQYQFAPRVVEDVWCRSHPDQCTTGHGYNPEPSETVPRSFSQSSFEVHSSVLAKGGRGVFAKEFIPQGSVIGLEACVQGMFIPSTSFALLRTAADSIDESVTEFFDTFRWGYIDGYGWLDSAYGVPAAGVDPGILTFVNHGCNGTYNVGARLTVNEMTMPLGLGPEGIYDDSNEIYHPYIERQFPQWDCQSFVALRDIPAGEELLDNYLVFGGGEDIATWDDNLSELKDMCTGGVGSITTYETEAGKTA